MHKLLILTFLLFLNKGFAQEDGSSPDYREDSDVVEFMVEEDGSEPVSETGAKPALPKIDPDKLVKEILESYKEAPEEQVVEHLKSRIRILPLGNMIAEDSRFFPFIARVLKHEKALPGLFGIIKDRKRLLIFLGLNILIFLAGYMWKRNHRNNSDVGMMDKIKRTFVRIITIQGFHFGLFLVYFRAEIIPFWEITSKTFFT